MSWVQRHWFCFCTVLVICSCFEFQFFFSALLLLYSWETTLMQRLSTQVNMEMRINMLTHSVPPVCPWINSCQTSQSIAASQPQCSHIMDNWAPLWQKIAAKPLKPWGLRSFLGYTLTDAAICQLSPLSSCWSLSLSPEEKQPSSPALSAAGSLNIAAF